MSTNKKIPETLRRGRRKGQAVKVQTGLEPKDYALVSILGDDWTENRSLLMLCEKICATRLDATLSKTAKKELDALAWSLLRALKDDPDWLERLIAVRKGEALRILTEGRATGRARGRCIDPVGMALARLSLLQKDGRLGALSAQHLADYVAEWLNDATVEGEDVPTNQTLRVRFLSMGGKMDSRRGRKNNDREVRLPSMSSELVESLGATLSGKVKVPRLQRSD